MELFFFFFSMYESTEPMERLVCMHPLKGLTTAGRGGEVGNL